MIGVSQEFEIQTFFGAKLFVRIYAVETHAENHGVALGIFWLIHLKIMSFAGAARSLVLGIKIQNDPFATVILEADRRSPPAMAA